MSRDTVSVLLIEDNPVDARLIQELLSETRRLRFDVQVADRLAAGLARLAEGGVQVVLLDLGLPDSNGLETLDAVRAKASKMPIVVLTGLDDEFLGVEAVKHGAQDYFPKRLPTGDILARAIRYALERQRLAEELEASRLEQLHYQRRLNRELAMQNRELEEFAYVASHDLKEPLRKLVAFSGLLRRDLGENLPERVARDLGFITDSACRMQALVDDLLALSRAGRADMQRRRISLDSCVDAALEALRVSIDKTGAEIQRDPLPQIWGDATLLTQLYQNLIGNALKFSGPQRPVIRITACKEGKRWILGVQDNGIGIKPEYEKQIFTAFQRLHTRQEYEGSGIGLAICRRAVERHGGKIWAEPVPGQGSHFKFYLGQRSEKSRNGGNDPRVRPPRSSPRRRRESGSGPMDASPPRRTTAKKRSGPP